MTVDAKTQDANIIQLSIIIPAYNAEAHIIKCLNSLYKQGLEEEVFEVIVSNDGSTDGTQILVEEFAKEKKNLRILNHDNIKLGGARNIGLNEAKGVYVLFVDSDDYLISGSLKILVSAAAHDDLDVLMADYVTENSDGSDRRPNRMYESNHENICSGQDFIKSNQIYWVAWLCLLKRKFIERHNLIFRSHVLYEDVDFSVKTLLLSLRVRYIPCHFYVHTRNPDSITRRNRNEIHFIDQIKAAEALHLVVSSTEKSQPDCYAVLINHVFLKYVEALKTATTLSINITAKACMAIYQSGMISVAKKQRSPESFFVRIINIGIVPSSIMIYFSFKILRFIKNRWGHINQIFH